ncbi:TPA: hypothetical protein PTV74_003180 [Clostridium botulinum]|nr:hypothetical protein [Clostridium botulinum]HDK7206335.1 hypothetical protein [Clostridium botulinum]HDK7210071.1 hypothetical protein [Clostridium botulinum]HDK7265520.1 hypothetical protein [Clostridium botulinum]HDK7269368.1 hypothetical protein [Clostridium botulinum]
MSMLNDELSRIAEIGKATEELFKLTDTIEFGDRFDQEEGFECIARDTEELLEWYRKKKIR